MSRLGLNLLHLAGKEDSPPLRNYARKKQTLPPTAPPDPGLSNNWSQISSPQSGTGLTHASALTRRPFLSAPFIPRSFPFSHSSSPLVHLNLSLPLVLPLTIPHKALHIPTFALKHPTVSFTQSYIPSQIPHYKFGLFRGPKKILFPISNLRALVFANVPIISSSPSLCDQFITVPVSFPCFYAKKPLTSSPYKADTLTSQVSWKFGVTNFVYVTKFRARQL